MTLSFLLILPYVFNINFYIMDDFPSILSDIPKVKNQKLAPTAPEAERSVLGCLLLDKDSMVKVGDLLVAEDFYHDHHKFIFEACRELFARSEPIDLVTVATKLQSRGKLEVIGGPEYLAELQNEVPVSTHIFQYAQLVKHRSTLRKLIAAGQDVTSLGL